MTLGLDSIYDRTEPIKSELQLRPGNEVIVCVREDKARFNSAPFTLLRWGLIHSFIHSHSFHYFSFVRITHGQWDCSRLNFTTASGYSQSDCVPGRRSYRSAQWCNLSLVWIPRGTTRRATCPEKDLKEEKLPFERQEPRLAWVSPWSQPGFCAVRLVQSMPSFLERLDPVYVPEHMNTRAQGLRTLLGELASNRCRGCFNQTHIKRGVNPETSSSATTGMLRDVNTLSFCLFFLNTVVFQCPWLFGEEPFAVSLSDGCCSGLNPNPNP